MVRKPRRDDAARGKPHITKRSVVYLTGFILWNILGAALILAGIAVGIFGLFEIVKVDAEGNEIK
jgi:hypothetical protein